MAAAIFCWMKKKKKTEQKTKLIHFEEHRKVKEAIVEGPHGTEAIVLSIEDDVVIDGEIKKSEKIEKGLHAKKDDEASSFIEIVGALSESSDHHHHRQDHLAEHKG